MVEIPSNATEHCRGTRNESKKSQNPYSQKNTLIVSQQVNLHSLTYLVDIQGTIPWRLPQKATIGWILTKFISYWSTGYKWSIGMTKKYEAAFMVRTLANKLRLANLLVRLSS
jgi:hypothetical protein